MKTYKPDYCFLVIEGRKPDIIEEHKPAEYIKTPNGYYVLFKHIPYDFDKQQQLAEYYGGNPRVRRLIDYSQPKTEQTTFWVRRGQPNIRLCLVSMIDIVVDTEFIVHLGPEVYVTLTFASYGAALNARRNLLCACLLA